ncbi:MAG TPA: 1,2-phenylacetyl-CoA epoxidase subunit PaaD [Actinomycetota bacterium]|nr:1,2-phenylacetyl-CoA epoxidase subunit PaaD [Actinomycetota bacterium]
MIRDDVARALESVVDPEIPSCSIVDLGMVERVEVTDDVVHVELLPTFVGCPAKNVIGQDVRKALESVCGPRRIEVVFVYDPPWTASRVTETGRERLREYGISSDRLGGTAHGCPYCGSADTVVESPFGPTPCRSTHFCNACRNVFEGFKDKGGPVLTIARGPGGRS